MQYPSYPHSVITFIGLGIMITTIILFSSMAGCVLVHGIRINKSCPRVDTINRSVRDVSTLRHFYGLYVCVISEEVNTKCTEKNNEIVRNLSF